MNNLSVAFYWHFHQPVSSQPDNKILTLPWVRLHLIKDYLDMLKHIQNFPGIYATFNFTPSLFMLIEGYEQNKLTDRQFELFKKDAQTLTIEEKIEILRDFFLANWERMVEPYPRYHSLLLKRGKYIVEDELPTIAKTFTPDEMRDLQIWSNLVWIDPIFRSEIMELYNKEKNFSENDKLRVIELQKKIINATLDEYKRAFASGKIEITTSPLHHPILPLLFDSRNAKICDPNLELDIEFSFPDDARIQIDEGIKIFKRIFGRPPRGFWPPEGGVCKELFPILKKAGIEWIATDEELLARSLRKSFSRDNRGMVNNAELLYQPWQYEDLIIFFRDRTLSNLIYHTYNSYDPEFAARDFVDRIIQLKNSLPPFKKFILPIILDGENPWENYPSDGSRFLDALYENLIKKQISTTTFSKFLKQYKNPARLKTIFPGTWAGANLNAWIKYEEDQKAWKVVADLRKKIVKKNIRDKKVWQRFYILEGSDWFWWFGGQHYAPAVEAFDELFRANAIAIYRWIGEEPPPELFSPIKKATEVPSYQPIDIMTPIIDGRLTHFYEWFNAGYADVKRLGGTRHRFAGVFSMVYCGFNQEFIYIRFDVEGHKPGEYQYKIKFFSPKEIEFNLAEPEGFDCKIDEIGEVAIPRNRIVSGDEHQIEFIMLVIKNGTEIDHTPVLKFNVDLKSVKLNNWLL
ncbi:hypothetical protein BXT86_01440 [candidate division WOR-3 bacterium 4484_100]|uniref:Glycoside hydrolase family 57 N-terminal domain-containing protein n=1 Tax=candidate division WOR-3 bacterium 4484_100 TaxID=1936077 RepID=A0A1V4QG83_UNCW3|nr:MAG: hypothetical protein BXT86_01440 [candidate division WOR-3 bacterium 4484_100]